jgi:chromate transport protein ChrA
MDTFQNILVRAHSGLRYVVLALILAAIVNAIIKKKSGTYSNGDRKLNLFAMISVHVQLLIGLVLYAISDKVNFAELFSSTVNRFYGVEHIFGMLLAVVLVTIAHAKSKKMEDANKKHRIIMLGYLFALIIIFATIPWPFRDLGGKWF